MKNLKLKFLSGVTTTAVILGSVAAPAFAETALHISSNESGGHIQTEVNTWFGDENGFSDLFDGFFGRKLRANLDGQQEVPEPGDLDGRGEAKVKIKENKRSFSSNKNQLCVNLEVTYIDRASAAHIHHAPAGSTGAVVISLPIPDEEGKAKDCVDVDSQLLQKIKDNPQDYYINVHNNAYPNGAIRGQLSK